MKIFIINLKRDTQKREHMKNVLDRIDCDYEFFEAINGSDVDTTKFKSSCYWMDPYHHTHITEGYVGCTLSHFAVWQKMVDSNTDRAIILEDDVELLDDDFINKCNAIDVDYDLVFLGRKKMGSDDEEIITENPTLVKPIFSYWTCAYLLSYAGATRLSYDQDRFYNNIIPSDEYIPHMCGMQHFNHESSLRIEKSYGPMPDDFVSLAFDPPLIKPVNDAFSFSSTYHSESYFNYSNDICCLSIATESNDCCARYADSCRKYGINPYIMGIGKKWSGGNMAKGPGGGQKVNLVREFISTLDDDQLFVFTDNYDVISNNHVSLLIERYKQYYDEKIVFAGETSCWPDSALSAVYPEVDDMIVTRYLNSGLFMGYVRDIKHLVNTPIKNDADDQLYYTRKFLYGDENIVIDYDCRLFLCLNGITDSIEIDKSKSCITYKGERPIFIHGNGPESVKIFLNNIVTNYCLEYNSTYGFHKKKDILDRRILYVIHETSYISSINYYQQLLLQDYPKNMIDVLVIYSNDEFKTQFDNVNSPNNYNSFIVAKETENVWNQIITWFDGLNCDYVYYHESKINISNPRCLVNLVSQDRKAIAPLIRETGTSYANFWGDIGSDGFYKRSSNYLAIINREEIGCWNVPYITHIMLLSKELMTSYNFTQHDQSYSDSDMIMCSNIRDRFNFMYVLNTEIWGNLSVDVNLNTICNNQKVWEEKYLNNDASCHRWNYENLGNNIYKLYMFNETFCEDVINVAEQKACWSKGGDKYYDARIGGYESHPTQDIQLNELNLNEMWDNIIKLYIAPFIDEEYNYATKEVNLAFVVKYSMEGQKDLRPHHDSSTYTVNICLNDEFEGGGCNFIKTNQTIKNKDVGSIIIHPGKLTHYHKGISITDGTRYILVSFVN